MVVLSTFSTANSLTKIPKLISSLDENSGGIHCRHSPRCAFAVEVDFVLDPPKNPGAENVVDRVHDARQEEAFLQIERDVVVSHGPRMEANVERFVHKQALRAP